MFNVELLKTAVLISLNKTKLAEFRHILGETLSIAEGPDREEISAEPFTVALYKSKAAGPGTIVEDTVLFLDGVEIVDIRFKLAELRRLKKTVSAIWQVILGFNDGQHVYLFSGGLHGELRPLAAVPPGAFGFDPYFFPNNHTVSLHDLTVAGRKYDASARVNAIRNMMQGEVMECVALSAIPDWTGGYQA